MVDNTHLLTGSGQTFPKIWVFVITLSSFLKSSIEHTPDLPGNGIGSTRIELEQNQFVAVNMVHCEDANTRNDTLH